MLPIHISHHCFNFLIHIPHHCFNLLILSLALSSSVLNRKVVVQLTFNLRIGLILLQLIWAAMPLLLILLLMILEKSYPPFNKFVPSSTIIWVMDQQILSSSMKLGLEILISQSFLLITQAGKTFPKHNSRILQINILSNMLCIQFIT